MIKLGLLFEAIRPGMWQQYFCHMRGHADLLYNFSKTRVWLKCSTCGWESPGIHIDRVIQKGT